MAGFQSSTADLYGDTTHVTPQPVADLYNSPVHVASLPVADLYNSPGHVTTQPPADYNYGSGHVTTQSTVDYYGGPSQVTPISPQYPNNNEHNTVIDEPFTIQHPNLIPNKPIDGTNDNSFSNDVYGSPISHSNDVEVQYHGDYGLKTIAPSTLYKRNARANAKKAGTPIPDYLVANEQSFKKNRQPRFKKTPQSQQFQAVVKRNTRREKAGRPIPDFLVANQEAFSREYDSEDNVANIDRFTKKNFKVV